MATTLQGTAKGEKLEGKSSSTAYIILGEAGNDSLKGNSQADSLDGGVGNDSLKGGSGDDTIFGGADRDTLYGDAGRDYLVTGSSADSLTSGEKAYGGTGDDTIEAFNLRSSYLYGEDGNDRIAVTGFGFVFDEDGVGTLASTGIKTDGGKGNDFITYNDAQGSVYGGSGNDTVVFGPSAGGYVDLGSGNDLFDNVDDSSNVKVKGGSGSDTIFGYDGGDSLYGDDGNDVIYWGSTMQGGSGDDTLVFGGETTGTMTGGGGRDTFVFADSDRTEGFVITDFKKGQDKLLIDQGEGMTFADLTLTVESGDTRVSFNHPVNENLVAVLIEDVTGLSSSDFVFSSFT